MKLPIVNNTILSHNAKKINRNFKNLRNISRYINPDYKVYKKSSKTLRICGFAQIFCIHFNEVKTVSAQNCADTVFYNQNLA